MLRDKDAPGVLKKIFFPLIVIFFLSFQNLAADTLPEKIVICGVCRNIEAAVSNTIKNIEELGNHFSDYQVVIYENNSTDRTAQLLNDWSNNNPHVLLITEKLPSKNLPASRTSKIARARNIVLEAVKDLNYSDFKYLVMVDLDFKKPWPIEEILKTLEAPIEWDAVSANGVVKGGLYHDYYAFRDKGFPFGPELNGSKVWRKHAFLPKFKGKEWHSVFSAFGGLALYKTKTILQYIYSGSVTSDLKKYYQNILLTLPPTNPYLQDYLEFQRISQNTPLLDIPIRFRDKICCEHLPLHASMALNGYGKFYVNPALIMKYD